MQTFAKLDPLVNLFLLAVLNFVMLQARQCVQPLSSHWFYLVNFLATKPNNCQWLLLQRLVNMRSKEFNETWKKVVSDFKDGPGALHDFTNQLFTPFKSFSNFFYVWSFSQKKREKEIWN